MPKHGELRVGKKNVAVSNLDKVLYPKTKFTKGQVLDYYARVAEYLLPHFRNRPVTLVRWPDGVRGESFYEKNAPAFAPKWVQTFGVSRSQDPGDINYILINDAATLLWVANLAALELHPFLHRAPNIHQPTHVVFDLDPGEGSDILTCAEVAFLLRDLLTKLQLQSFPKVSGSKGIQVYVPLNTVATYDATSALAKAVADLLTQQNPNLVLSKMAKVLRKGKVFIDWSQNAVKKTTIGVYSLRAKREQPFVSMPVRWEELKTAMTRSDSDSLNFDPETALKRLKRLGDLFAPVLKLKQKLPKAFVVDKPGTPNPHRSSSPKLAAYAAKREFDKTAEPEPALPKRSAQGSRRRFVVQKHAASHLHYDFRLEMQDVLKSWAVPKGVPLVRGEKRGAYATEDHPIDYLDFEGIIPKGQYGGGTVMAWDMGTYERMEGNYYKGELTVFLTGKKLQGEWTLKRMKDQENGKAAWLLIKTDKDAAKIPAKQIDISVLTGRTLDQIAEQKSAVWESNRSETVTGRTLKPKAAKPPKTAAPEFVPPMRATLVDELPKGPEWIYEVKWDGYRALAAKHGDTVRLLSLKNKNLAKDFPAVTRSVQGLTADTALLDGEIVAVNRKGQPSFQILQNRASLGQEWQIVYYAFDLLNLEGEDLRQLPLETRKEKLEEVVRGSHVRFSAQLPGSPEEIVEAVEKAGLEGVIAKKRGSLYAGKARSMAWQKFKLSPAQEFVIGGYNPEGNSFSSVLVGYYERKRLIFAGKVRQGFNPRSRAMLMKTLQPLYTEDCPFVNLPLSKTGHFGEGITVDDMRKLRWIEPSLVAQVSFTEWTSYGLLRHATFLGLRDDKRPEEVARESSSSAGKDRPGTASGR